MSIGLSLSEKWFPMSGPLTSQPVLELIYAIVLSAASSAILFNVGASGGGTDIVAMILKKYTKMNIGAALFAVDLLIVPASCLVFDAQTGLFSFCGLLAKLSVMKRSQAVELRNFIHETQPSAFITITNSSEIIGKGFRGLN